jgi:transcriptional regulator with XRE-family HTH domain
LQEDDVTTRNRDPGAFGRRLATLRWRACLSRGQLAESSGVSVDAIQSLEQSRSSPTLRTVFRLAHGLGVTPTQLIEGLEAVDGQE